MKRLARSFSLNEKENAEKKIKVITSETHPQIVHFLDCLPFTGLLGGTFAPGKSSLLRGKNINRCDRRNLDKDVQRLKTVYKADVVISLLSDADYGRCYHRYTHDQIAQCYEKYGIIYSQYPIHDRMIPDNMDTFHAMIMMLTNLLIEGKNIVIHCISGQGRTGVVLGACMVCSEFDPVAAIDYLKKLGKGKWIPSVTHAGFLISYAEYIERKHQ